MCPYGTTKKNGFSRNFDLISGCLIKADDGVYFTNLISITILSIYKWNLSCFPKRELLEVNKLGLNRNKLCFVEIVVMN